MLLREQFSRTLSISTTSHLSCPSLSGFATSTLHYISFPSSTPSSASTFSKQSQMSSVRTYSKANSTTLGRLVIGSSPTFSSTARRSCTSRRAGSVGRSSLSRNVCRRVILSRASPLSRRMVQPFRSLSQGSILVFADKSPSWEGIRHDSKSPAVLTSPNCLKSERSSDTPSRTHPRPITSAFLSSGRSASVQRSRTLTRPTLQTPHTLAGSPTSCTIRCR